MNTLYFLDIHDRKTNLQTMRLLKRDEEQLRIASELDECRRVPKYELLMHCCMTDENVEKINNVNLSTFITLDAEKIKSRVMTIASDFNLSQKTVLAEIHLLKYEYTDSDETDFVDDTSSESLTHFNKFSFKSEKYSDKFLTVSFDPVVHIMLFRTERKKLQDNYNLVLNQLHDELEEYNPAQSR